jgi:regulatory protein
VPRQPASLKVRALRWLAQREHSRDELRMKLLRLAGRGTDDASDAEQAVDALLEWLVVHGYLSQARFVESRVHARQQRYGNLRIAHELRRHGVEIDAPTQIALQQSEWERAREVWRKKFGSPAPDAAGRVRQARFLAARGFSSDVVRRIIRTAGRGDESPPGLDDDAAVDS